MDYHYCSALFAGAGGGQKPLFSARQRLPSDNTAISTFSLIIEASMGRPFAWRRVSRKLTKSGVLTSLRRLFACLTVNERNRNFTPTIKVLRASVQYSVARADRYELAVCNCCWFLLWCSNPVKELHIFTRSVCYDPQLPPHCNHSRRHVSGCTRSSRCRALICAASHGHLLSERGSHDRLRRTEGAH